MKLLNLGTNTIFRKRLFDLDGNVAVNVTETVDNKSQEDQSHDANRGGDRGNQHVSLVYETAAAALGSDGMLTFGVSFSNSLCDRRQWLILTGLESLSNLFIVRRGGRIFPLAVISIVYSHNTRAVLSETTCVSAWTETNFN
jgi:hypothetical protein